MAAADVDDDEFTILIPQQCRIFCVLELSTFMELDRCSFATNFLDWFYVYKLFGNHIQGQRVMESYEPDPSLRVKFVFFSISLLGPGDNFSIKLDNCYFTTQYA